MTTHAPTPTANATWLTGQLNAMNAILVAGQWRWPGEAQAALRQHLNAMCHHCPEAGWHSALGWLDRTSSGERFASAELVACLMPLLRMLGRLAAPVVDEQSAAAQGRPRRSRVALRRSACWPVTGRGSTLARWAGASSSNPRQSTNH